MLFMNLSNLSFQKSALKFPFFGPDTCIIAAAKLLGFWTTLEKKLLGNSAVEIWIQMYRFKLTIDNECFKKRTTRWPLDSVEHSSTSFSKLHHSRHDEILHSHRGSSSLHCIFIGTFQDCSQALFAMAPDSKMFAQGGFLSLMGPPASTECCPCTNTGKCLDGTGCTPYSTLLRSWKVVCSIGNRLHTVNLFTMTATSSGAPAMVAADFQTYSLSSRAWSHPSLTCASIYILLYKDSKAHYFPERPARVKLGGWRQSRSPFRTGRPYRFEANFLVLLMRTRMA